MALPREALAKVLSSQKSLSRIIHLESRAQGYRNSSRNFNRSCHHNRKRHSHCHHSQSSSQSCHHYHSSHSLQAPHTTTQLRQWREILARGVRRSFAPASSNSLLSILLCSITGRQ